MKRRPREGASAPRARATSLASSMRLLDFAISTRTVRQTALARRPGGSTVGGRGVLENSRASMWPIVRTIGAATTLCLRARVRRPWAGSARNIELVSPPRLHGTPPPSRAARATSRWASKDTTESHELRSAAASRSRHRPSCFDRRSPYATNHRVVIRKVAMAEWDLSCYTCGPLLTNGSRAMRGEPRAGIGPLAIIEGLRADTWNGLIAPRSSGRCAGRRVRRRHGSLLRHPRQREHLPRDA